MLKRRKAIIRPNACVACGRCVMVCPVKAISVYKGIYALVDRCCVGCGKCEKVCPAGIISLEERKGA